jgi:hypothetical protein
MRAVSRLVSPSLQVPSNGIEGGYRKNEIFLVSFDMDCFHPLMIGCIANRLM